MSPIQGLATGPDKAPRQVVVVGSGVTGLCSGALLATMGHRVTVLERHPELLGGHVRSFDIEGLRFCAGPQYAWGFGEDGIGTRILRKLGLWQDNPFDPMDPDGFERVIVGDTAPFDVPVGLARFRAKLHAAFPAHAQPLDRFFDWMDALYDGTRVIFDQALYRGTGADMTAGILRSRRLSLGVKIRMLRAKGMTLGDLFDRCDVPPFLRRILYGHGGVFAERESTVSAVLYAGATGLFHAGPSYPRRGFDRLVDGLCALIRAHGGRVENGQEVRELLRGGRGDRDVSAVRCADGSIRPCDLVISGVAPRLTCRMLRGCDPGGLTYRPSNALVACYIGTDLPGVGRLLARRNLWWQDGREVDFDAPNMTAPPAMLYVGSPSATRGGPDRSPDGTQAVVVFAPGNFAQAKAAFEDGPASHDRLRERIREGLLSTLDRCVLPGLRDHLRFAVIHTPWDVFVQTGAEAGNAYGRRLDATAMLAGIGSVELPANVAVACASTGIPGVASGFQTAAALVRERTGTVV